MIQHRYPQNPQPRLAEVTPRPACHGSVVDTLAEFLTMEDEWQALMRRANADNIALDHQWLATWLHHFTPLDLLIIVVRNEKNELVGALPVMIQKTRSGLIQRTLRRAQLIGTDPCVFDQLDVPVAEGVPEEVVLQEIAKQLIAHRSRWDMLDLRFNGNRGQWETLASLLSADTAYEAVEETTPIPYVQLPKEEAELDATCRKKRLRQDLRYVSNRLRKEENETFRLEFQQAGPQADAMLQGFYERHIEYWQAKGHTSDFARFPALRSFYTEAFSRFRNGSGRLGEMCFSVIRFGETIVSWQIGFRHDGHYLAHLTNYNQAYKKYLPGIVHMDSLLVDTLRGGRPVFEFGRGDEDYKRQWTDTHKPLYNLRIYNRNAHLLCWKADRLIKRTIDQVKALVRKQEQ